MKKLLIRINNAITGFRGIITTIVTYVSLYVSSFFNSLTGVNHTALKGAALAAIPITLKLVWTDAWPKIQSWFKKEVDTDSVKSSPSPTQDTTPKGG